jgi:hypothetical protein
MQKQALVCALLLVSYENYNLKKSMDVAPVVETPTGFHVPYIQQVLPTEYGYAYHDFLKPGNSVFLGIYKWCDTLRIPDEVPEYRSKFEDREYSFLWKGRGDKFKTDGFELVPDYNSTIVYWRGCYEEKARGNLIYYPVYLVNSTMEGRYLILKDNKVFALQEAENPYVMYPDVFWPIEYNTENYQEPGKSAVKVDPGEFVLFIVPRYSGPNQAKMRVRLYNGDNIIVSNSYAGNFYFNQFMAKPGSELNRIIEEEDYNFNKFIRFMFLGAKPFQTDRRRS